MELGAGAFTDGIPPRIGKNGERFPAPLGVGRIVGGSVSQFDQMPDTPGYDVAAAFQITVLLFGRTDDSGNRTGYGWFFCDNELHDTSLNFRLVLL